MPEWVKKAVLYRDRGACGACNKDVSGLICIGNQKNFDHIVPLAQGGMNDVTNVQLLCEECNLKKGHANSFTSKQYERWY
jgi:5-methylcytosine-specific restriction endonuclease McrA